MFVCEGDGARYAETSIPVTTSATQKKLPASIARGELLLSEGIVTLRVGGSALPARCFYSKVTNALLYAYWFTRLSEWYPAPTSELSCSHLIAICPSPAMRPDSSAELNV